MTSGICIDGFTILVLPVEAWIDVPEKIDIVISQQKTFRFRYRLGSPNAVGYFKMLFFKDKNDRSTLTAPLKHTYQNPLPHAFFKPLGPRPTDVADVWYEGIIRITTATEFEAQRYYNPRYIGAGVIRQPHTKDIITEIPEELDLL